LTVTSFLKNIGICFLKEYLESKDVRNMLESGLTYVLFSTSEYFKETNQEVSANWLAFEAFKG